MNNLLRLLQYKNNDNVCISPFSLQEAFSMLTYAAKGETKEELENTIPYNDEMNIPEGFGLKIANSLWAGKKLKEDYVNYLTNNFNAYADTIGLEGKPINDWVNKETNGKISSIVPKQFDEVPACVLVNTVDFSGKWETEFKKDFTREDNFRSFDGTTSSTHFMNRFSSSEYYTELNGIKYLMLHYKCNSEKFNPVMILCLPPEGICIDNIVDKINLSNVYQSCYEREMDRIKFPKFKIEYAENLNSSLQELGVRKAFSDSSEIPVLDNTNDENIKISKVFHRTFIEVDEKGTEAAAASAIIGITLGTSIRDVEKKPSFIADRPFLGFIYDSVSNNTLFSFCYKKP